MSALLTRAAAIVEFNAAADYSANRGYSVTLAGETATLSASATVVASAVILDADWSALDAAGKVRVGILGAMDGTCVVKLSGVVAKGARLQQAADGTWVTDVGAGTARVVSFVALEAGVAGDLIEAAPIAAAPRFPSPISCLRTP